MSVGLIALLDDIAALARLASASLDDIAGQAAKASAKAAGVVIDDAAVTPRYMIGIKPEREIPAVIRVARGSLRNKIVFLLPACLALSQFAPWLITPLLMLGGSFLCYEGAEKVLELVFPTLAHAHEAEMETTPQTPQQWEDERVSSAIRTDFILSAEIMTIALGTIPHQSLAAQAVILLMVALAITVGVYGAVAFIVKLDDMGLALARRPAKGAAGRLVNALGRGMVALMPILLSALGIIGTVAMLWVGGGILLHGLEQFQFAGVPAWLAAQAELAGSWAGAAGGLVAALVNALGAAGFGLVLGVSLIALAHFVLAPLWRRLRP